ncbi:DNA polymerase III subunit beta [bacterium CG10_46_32]|nr:MAG: DNA polymerase III subunit beta [bacterium CG10_46_32]PIR56262.1 MAG: DNA polymerase III subunit beta [Parcubacteria group bacterium CG10_big_fil_rev_8_21_14_0_10_46_32]
MKLTCTQENLAHALSVVAPIATKGGTLPILSNVLMEAGEGTLKLSATNLEIGVTAHVRGKIEQEGTFTVNGRLFSDYVGLLGHDTVTLALSGENLEIRSGPARTKIHGQAAEEFPVIPTITAGPVITTSSSDFNEALSQVLFSASTSDARPELAGVLIIFEEKTITLVGTDSYRLAERKIELSAPAASKQSIIVPLRAASELARILAHSEGDFSISFSENQVLFSVGDVEFLSRLVSGTFPNYQEIIPKNSTTKVAIDKEPLVRAIKSASLFCRQGLNHVSFQFSSDRIMVSASASALGENTIELPAKIEGADCDIVFDYRYVLDGLSAIRSSEVQIQLSGSTSPGVFTPNKSDGYLYLVMPIKQ